MTSGLKITPTKDCDSSNVDWVEFRLHKNSFFPSLFLKKKPKQPKPKPQNRSKNLFFPTGTISNVVKDCLQFSIVNTISVRCRKSNWLIMGNFLSRFSLSKWRTSQKLESTEKSIAVRKCNKYPCSSNTSNYPWPNILNVKPVLLASFSSSIKTSKIHGSPFKFWMTAWFSIFIILRFCWFWWLEG